MTFRGQASTTVMAPVYANNAVVGDFVDAAAPFAWGAEDAISWFGQYEEAT